MKLTEKQKNQLKTMWGDWELFHGRYDMLVENRLRELDPEFYEDLKKQTQGATFWYA